MAFYPEQILDTIALCEGYDGLGLGISFLEPAYRNICGVEREIGAAANMAEKTEKIFMDEKTQWSDVSTFRIPRLRGLVDCITVGIPCQPFSTAGQHKGIEDKRFHEIWGSVREIVREIMPGIIFMEEVSGITKFALGTIINNLDEIGYVCAWDYFQARDVECPQKKRERIFILAKLADSNSEHDDRKRYESSAFCGERSTPTEISRLVNPNSIRKPSGNKSIQRKARTDADRTNQGARLENSDCGGSGTWGTEYEGQFWSSSPDSTGSTQKTINIWPARSGLEQYDWEPDRIIRHSKCKGLSGSTKIETMGQSEKDTEFERPIRRPVKPTLGRDAYGITNRVDEVRLCGNGIISTMATLAWFVLKSTLIENGIW